MMYRITGKVFLIVFLAFESADPLWITISENDPDLWADKIWAYSWGLTSTATSYG